MEQNKRICYLTDTFIQKQFTVPRAYILNVAGPGNRTHNPGASRFIEDHTDNVPSLRRYNIFLYLYFSAVRVSGGFEYGSIEDAGQGIERSSFIKRTTTSHEALISVNNSISGGPWPRASGPTSGDNTQPSQGQ